MEKVTIVDTTLSLEYLTHALSAHLPIPLTIQDVTYSLEIVRLYDMTQSISEQELGAIKVFALDCEVKNPTETVPTLISLFIIGKRNHPAEELFFAKEILWTPGPFEDIKNHLGTVLSKEATETGLRLKH